MSAEPSRAVLLSARGLATRAGGRTLQRDLDLDLAAGEVVAVRGPSGSGKTTLLRTLACLQDAASGEIRLRGAEPGQVGWPAWRRQVAMVFQVPAIFPGTVGENLARPFGYRHAGAAFDAGRARELLDRVRLREVGLEASAERLSVGQQQRVALVRTLLLQPAVLLLDEPTSALDARAADAVVALVRAATAEREAAALVVTHETSRGAAWFDRALDLDATGAAS